MRIALVALAACGAPSAPRIANAPTAPASPAPRIARGPQGLTALDLPAVADDGSRVILAVHEDDGDRGLPNLTLVVRDHRNRDLERHVVLSRAEADTMLDDAEGHNPRLDARVRLANAWLADHHAALALVPMRVLVPEPTPTPAERTRATGDGVTIAWRANRVVITGGASEIAAGSLPVTVRRDDGCARTAYLAAAAIDRARQIAVVTIDATADGDLCAPTSATHYIVTW